MVSIKKYKNTSKTKLKKSNKKNYSISKGGDVQNQRICKGRAKEECNDGTGNCQFIDGAKRKYCKRVSKCKKGCQAPCQKVMYNNNSYCIPPDKDGKPQNIEDVKDILSELIVEGSSASNENTQVKEAVMNSSEVNSDNQLIQSDNNSKSDNNNSKSDNNNNSKSDNNNSKSDNNLNKKEAIDANTNNSEEKGSVVSILYGKSSYDKTAGSCSIL